MKFVVTGAKGQLAKEFIKHFEKAGIEYIAFTRQELDISNLDDVRAKLKNLKFDVLINCAAYNNVDRAEEDFVHAFKVNSVGVYNLALICSEKEVLLVHFSTDYVFDGTKGNLYKEDDIPNPINQYAKSKLLGENLVDDVLEEYLLFRVSWVYGNGKQNFIYKLLQWSKDNDVLKIAFNEVSVPTYTEFIVENTLEAIKKELRGLYHLVPEGYASRYEWAKKFFELIKRKKILIPVEKEVFNLPAKRPNFSAMSSQKIQKKLNKYFPTWEEVLSRFVATLL